MAARPERDKAFPHFLLLHADYEFNASTFAASRTVGWLARVLEQYADNRLMRPKSKCVGPWGRRIPPIENRSLPMASTDKDRNSGSREHARRVLVIDQEDDERQTISDIVNQEGHDAVTASTGEEALNHVRDGQIHLVLTDMTLPDMNGWQLLETIKGQHPDLKAVVLTSVVPESEGTSRLGEMADGYLEKPIDPEGVRASLKAFLRPEGLGRLAEVLLVDHNPDTRTVIGSVLRDRGFSVELSENPQDALRLIQGSAPDLCIVRLVFLGETGLDFCSLLRSNPEHADLPIMLIAEKPSKDDVVRAAELGVSEFIVEPIDPEELQDRAIQMLR